MSCWFGLACASVPAAEKPVVIERAGCQVELGVSRPKPLVLEVSASCTEHMPSGFSAEPGVAAYLRQVRTNAGESLAVDSSTTRLPMGARGIRYGVDLGSMAAEQHDLDVALEVGGSVLAPGYSWLLSPLGIPPDTSVLVRVLPGLDQTGFMTGLTRDAAGYRLRANEIRVATFAVFGRFERTELSVPGLNGGTAHLNLVTLDGPLAAEPETVRRWVGETALAVSDFYGGFPVEKAMLTLVPVEGRRSVLHGKVLPESSPGIALLVGSQAQADSLYGDWILTHELFHLGFPSFEREGKWLDEGLATYFEPLIRARAGWISERQLWHEFSRHMPLGVQELEGHGLESPSSVRAMYWAGATLCLLADVEARQQSAGTVGLEHGVRSVLRAGGDATRVWQLHNAIARIDATLGAPILRTLSVQHRTAGKRIPLQRLLTELGVHPRGASVRLEDSAPLAGLRRAITRGRP